MSKNHLVLLTIFIAIFSFGLAIVQALPNGANVTASAPQTAPNNADPSNATAWAGNITELSISGVSTTQTWQGYFGNVSGTIQLANSQSRVMYNWSLASPQGEVYASTNSSISWSNVQCFNFTAAGTLDSEVAGITNLNGTNASQLETAFGISSTDADGLEETFTSPGAGHDAFITGVTSFTAGKCPSTAVYDTTQTGQDGSFEEALLYEPTSTSVIFAALLENNLAGFDTGAHDFEMLVLENGHAGNTASTPYFFFVELS